MDNAIKFAGIANPHALGAYGVSENAKKLLRYVFCHQKLTFIGCAHLPARANWELKHGIAKHQYEDSEATTALRKRLAELRTSTAVVGKAPDPHLDLLFEELIHIRSDLEYAMLVYGFVKPKLLQIYRKHVQETQQIVDQPTIRMFQQIIWDLEQQVAWGEKMIAHLKTVESLEEEQEQFVTYIQNIERLAGGLDAKGAKSISYAERIRSHTPFVMTLKAARDASMGPRVHYRNVDGLTFENDQQKELVYMMRIRQQELVAAEMIAGVIYQQQDILGNFTQICPDICGTKPGIRCLVKRRLNSSAMTGEACRSSSRSMTSLFPAFRRCVMPSCPSDSRIGR